MVDRSYWPSGPLKQFMATFLHIIFLYNRQLNDTSVFFGLGRQNPLLSSWKWQYLIFFSVCTMLGFYHGSCLVTMIDHVMDETDPFLPPSAAKSLQSCPTLCDPRDGSPPGSPIRLPHPWDPPSKNTGMGCHFLLQCMKVESENEVAQSCATLSDPMDCSAPASSIHGIFQARVLEWVPPCRYP